MGRHLGGAVMDIALVLGGAGAAKVIKVLGKTKYGQKLIKAMEAIRLKKADKVLDEMAEGGAVLSREVYTDADMFSKGAGKADFYVKPNGDVIPSTGYRYMSREAPYIDELKITMQIPANPKGTYITFDKFDVPNPGKLQVPHDASMRGSFDTLQIIDDIRIPKGKWGEADWLEPITKDFPKYGPGGATQAVTNKPIKLETLEDLLNK